MDNSLDDISHKEDEILDRLAKKYGLGEPINLSKLDKPKDNKQNRIKSEFKE